MPADPKLAHSQQVDTVVRCLSEALFLCVPTGKAGTTGRQDRSAKTDHLDVLRGMGTACVRCGLVLPLLGGPAEAAFLWRARRVVPADLAEACVHSMRPKKTMSTCVVIGILNLPEFPPPTLAGKPRHYYICVSLSFRLVHEILC